MKTIKNKATTRCPAEASVFWCYTLQLYLYHA